MFGKRASTIIHDETKMQQASDPSLSDGNSLPDFCPAIKIALESKKIQTHIYRMMPILQLKVMGLLR